MQLAVQALRSDLARSVNAARWCAFTLVHRSQRRELGAGRAVDAVSAGIVFCGNSVAHCWLRLLLPDALSRYAGATRLAASGASGFSASSAAKCWCRVALSQLSIPIRGTLARLGGLWLACLRSRPPEPAGGEMPVRYLSDPELARLSSWPDEIDVADAVTYFTPSGDDLSWIAGFNRARTGWA